MTSSCMQNYHSKNTILVCITSIPVPPSKWVDGVGGGGDDDDDEDEDDKDDDDAAADDDYDESNDGIIMFYKLKLPL